MPIGGFDGTHQRPGAGGLPGGARNLDAGHLLIGLGAIMLFVSLFLEWFTPTAEAWDVFEVWDLVLAALAIAALVAVASRFGVGPPRPASWLIGASVAALVIVLYTLIDPPPAVNTGAGPEFGDPGTGLWLALAASILMVAGTLLSVARISVNFSSGGPGGGHRGHHDDYVDPAGSNPAVPQPTRQNVAGEPGFVEPAGRGGRFGRGGPAEPVDPVGPGAGNPPTEPTRRI